MGRLGCACGRLSLCGVVYADCLMDVGELVDIYCRCGVGGGGYERLLLPTDGGV